MMETLTIPEAGTITIRPPPDEFTSDQMKLRNLVWGTCEWMNEVIGTSTRHDFSAGWVRGEVQGVVRSATAIGAKDKSESWAY